MVGLNRGGIGARCKRCVPLRGSPLAHCCLPLQRACVWPRLCVAATRCRRLGRPRLHQLCQRRVAHAARPQPALQLRSQALLLRQLSAARAGAQAAQAAARQPAHAQRAHRSGWGLERAGGADKSQPGIGGQANKGATGPGAAP